MFGAPREKCDTELVWAGGLLSDAQSGQQVLAEGHHQPRPPAVRGQVCVVVEAVPHASKQGKEGIPETHL